MRSAAEAGERDGVVAARGWKGEVNLRSVLGLAWVEERGDMRCVRVEEGLVPAPHVVGAGAGQGCGAAGAACGRCGSWWGILDADEAASLAGVGHSPAALTLTGGRTRGWSSVAGEPGNPRGLLCDSSFLAFFPASAAIPKSEADRFRQSSLQAAGKHPGMAWSVSRPSPPNSTWRATRELRCSDAEQSPWH